MLKLFENPLSGNCYKVRLLLRQLGIPFQRIFVDVLPGTRRPDAFLSHTTIGRVPLLELDDGSALAESNAILHYLAVDTPYLPDDSLERSRVLAWMFFEQNLHEPNIATRRYWVSIAPDSAPRAAQLDFWLENGKKALGIMERELEQHDFFGSPRYSIADIALFGYTHVAPEGGFELEPYPAVRAWLQRVREQPGFVPMF
jgi:glutathione S-transferase